MHGPIGRDDIKARPARPIDICVKDRHRHRLPRRQLHAGLLRGLRENDLVIRVALIPVVTERFGAEPDQPDVIHDGVDGLDHVVAGTAGRVEIALEYDPYGNEVMTLICD